MKTSLSLFFSLSFFWLNLNFSKAGTYDLNTETRSVVLKGGARTSEKEVDIKVTFDEVARTLIVEEYRESRKVGTITFAWDENNQAEMLQEFVDNPENNLKMKGVFERGVFTFDATTRNFIDSSSDAKKRRKKHFIGSSDSAQIEESANFALEKAGYGRFLWKVYAIARGRVKPKLAYEFCPTSRKLISKLYLEIFGKEHKISEIVQQ